MTIQFRYVEYANSELNDYLNSDFVNIFSKSVEGAIKEVEVTTNGTTSSAQVYTPWGIDYDSSDKLANTIFWSAGEESTYDNYLKGTSTAKNLARTRDESRTQNGKTIQLLSYGKLWVTKKMKMVMVTVTLIC